MAITLSAREESKIRAAARASRCPVVVVSGDSAPLAVGERAYHTFRNSDRVVQYPGSALRAGYRLDYHASTYCVEVGVEWVRAIRVAELERRLAATRRKLAKKFTPDTPDSVLADYCEDAGDIRAATLLRQRGAYAR